MKRKIDLSQSAMFMHSFHRLHVLYRRYRVNAVASCVLALLSLLLWIQRLGKDNFMLFPNHEAINGIHVMAQAHTSKHQIPPKMWQIMLPKASSDTERIIDLGELYVTPTWLALNPDYM